MAMIGNYNRHLNGLKVATIRRGLTMSSLQLMMFNLAVSWGLSVLIWMVQGIVYPGFHRIPSADFIEYHRWYVRRISVIVLPLMISEVIATAMWLLEVRAPEAVISAILVVIIWLSTFLLQVPIHDRLKSGKDEAQVRRLVATNWIRTGAWSLKALTVTLAVIRGA